MHGRLVLRQLLYALDHETRTGVTGWRTKHDVRLARSYRRSVAERRRPEASRRLRIERVDGDLERRGHAMALDGVALHPASRRRRRTPARSRTSARRLRHSSWSSHCTPRTNAVAAGISMRLDDAVRRPRDRSDPCSQSQHRLVVIAVDLTARSRDALPASSPASRRPDASGCGGSLGAGDRRRDQRAPLVPPRAGVIGAAFGILGRIPVQRAAERHVQDLAPSADPEQGDATLDRESSRTRARSRRERARSPCGRMRLGASVSPGLDVPASCEHEGVDPLDQLDPVGSCSSRYGSRTGNAPAASRGRPYPNP